MAFGEYIRRNLKRYDGLGTATIQAKTQGLAPLFGNTEPSSAGWGIIFGESVSQEIRAYLRSTLGHHRICIADNDPQVMQEAKHRWMNLRSASPGENAEHYLRDVTGGQQRPGAPIDPRFFPYYILIVADPAEIGFRFERDLGIQNAVGRLWFGNDAAVLPQYQAYVQRLIASEGQERSLPAVGILLPETDDESIKLGAKIMVCPLFKGLATAMLLADPRPTSIQYYRWSRKKGEVHVADDFLFSLSHGKSIPYDGQDSTNQERLKHQGAPIASEGVDLENDLQCLFAENQGRPRGWWAFACHSAGSTQQSISFAIDGFGDRVAQHVSDMASQLSRDALASVNFFIGSVNRITTLSFSDVKHGAFVNHFMSFIGMLIRGERVGYAREHALSGLWVAALKEIEDKRPHSDPASLQEIEENWTRFNDLSNLCICGDPAARL